MKNFESGILKIVRDSKSEQFSFFDYIYSASKGPEEALLYSKLFWPDLVDVNGYVFLSENYDRDYFDEVVSEYGESKVEETINTTYLYNLVGGKTEYENEVWEALGNVLCETWRQRAQYLFPERSFAVEFSWYSDHDDPGVTLYQRREEEKEGVKTSNIQ